MPNTTPSAPLPRAAVALPALTLCELEDTGIDGLESYSPFCLKVHRALRLAGLPYTRRHATNPATHRRHNPTGQVPVLLVGDEAVSDSTRILARIERLGGRTLFAGLDARGRAEALLWEELADTSLGSFLTAARWADDRNWPLVKQAYFGTMPGPVRAIVPELLRRRQIGVLVARDVWRAGPDACWERLVALLDQLESRAPATGFWLGTSPTVADLALFAQLHGLRAPLTAWQRDRIAERRALSAWLDRVDHATSAGRQTERVAMAAE